MHTVDDETTNLEQYVQYIDKTCSRMIVRNWTACSHFGDIMAHKLRRISNTRQLLSDNARREDGNRREKRGFFYFVGKISKALFGTVDDEDAQFCHDQIERFEQGTTTLTQVTKQQMVVFNLTLCTFNEKLSDVEYNEIKMREGVSQLQTYIANFGSQIENTTYLLSLKIAIERLLPSS